MEYDILQIALNYGKDKKVDKEMSTFLTKELFFKWYKVEEIQGERKIIYKKEKQISDLYGSNQIQKKNKKIFTLSNLGIISISDIDQSLLSFFKRKTNKYLNLFPIYAMIKSNENLNINYLTTKRKRGESLGPNQIEEKLKDFAFVKSGLSMISIMEKKFEENRIKNVFDLKNSSPLFKDVQDLNYGMTQDERKVSGSVYNLNMNLKLASNFCMEIDGYYYNKITSDKIEGFTDPKTRKRYYIIPTKEDSVFLLLVQITEDYLKKEIIDNNKSIYEKFMQFHPALKNDLLKFSVSISKSTLILDPRQNEKTIYLPSFSIDTHLFANDVPSITKRIKIAPNVNNESKITSIDEYIKFELLPETDFGNGFSVVPIEDGKNNIVVRDPFILAVLNSNVMTLLDVPMLQMIYVTPDNWTKVKKNN